MAKSPYHKKIEKYSPELNKKKRKMKQQQLLCSLGFKLDLNSVCCELNGSDS